MKKLMLLFVLCHTASAVKHSLKTINTGSSGVPNIPEYVSVMVADGIQSSYCDSNKNIELRQDCMKKIFENNHQLVEFFAQLCFVIAPYFFRTEISSLKQQFSQSGGVHILQSMIGCELEENTGEIIGMFQYGYDGEDFIEFDLKTQTWIALKPEADVTKQRWDADRNGTRDTENLLTKGCPGLLKMYLDNENSCLQRTVLPKVSLLQKTPSSPVSCHATGFYPDRAMMFWRKDGEEIHEDVDHKEILPNNDETFQMSVDLNVASVTPEDWRRYDCVFHLSGVEDDIVTKLNNSVIRTNRGEKIPDEEKPSDMMILIIAAVFVLVLILIAAVGFAVYKKKKDRHQTSSPENNAEVSERLTLETM